MLNGLTGWHVLVILGVLIVMAAVAVAVILLAVRLARRPAPGVPAVAAGPSVAGTNPPRASSAELRAARLAELDDLSARGLLSVSEYEAKRAEILGEI